MSEKLMTLKVDTAAGITVEHLYYHQERAPAEKLLVVLPGRGYLASHPVLHYLQKMARSLGYDVLSVQYSFQVTSQASGGKTPGWEELTDEANRAICSLPRQNYGHVCFAGKSLGTPLAVTLAQNSPAQDTRLLLLTPIANAVESAGEIPTLAIIGTADAAYNADTVAADADRPNITWRVFEGLNHGLEAADNIRDDWRTSVNALVDIIAACEDFLRA